MQRRTFLKNTIGISAAVATTSISLKAGAAEANSSGQEYYEFRAYRLKAGAPADPLHQFLRDAAIPKLNALGVRPIGVFSEIEPKDPGTVFVILTHPTLEIYARAAQWLRNDSAAIKLASSYLESSKDKPAFDRIDSWLLLAFAGMPRMELPSFSKERKSRIFELRTYESHNEIKAAKKVDMFNDGEMDVMREVGLHPVFYGEALIGPHLPHLTYMLSAEDESSHKAHWDAFIKHPTWDKMKNDPKYADTVSKIEKWMLKPTDYSQV